MIKKIMASLGALAVVGSANAQTCIDNAPPIHAEGNYIDRKNGVVLDVSTGLLWSKCNVGETYSIEDNSCSGTPTNFPTWQSALLVMDDPVNTTVAGETGFRLPNIKELQSIVNYNCLSPAVSTEVFVSALNAPYWTNTPDVFNVNEGSGYDGLLIDFKDGQEVDSKASGLILLRTVKHIQHSAQ